MGVIKSGVSPHFLLFLCIVSSYASSLHTVRENPPLEILDPLLLDHMTQCDIIMITHVWVVIQYKQTMNSKCNTSLVCDKIVKY